MQEIIMDFINTYGVTILYTILTAVASYVGVKVKNIYEKYINDKTKQQVVSDTVKYVEQLYKDLSGEEKLGIAMENAVEILSQKGIEITTLELRVLVESTCNSFKDGFNKESKEEEK